MSKFESHDLESFNTWPDVSGKAVWAYYPQHPNAHKDGRMFFHRLVMENKINRYLEAYEIVHHLDGNALNNDPLNLVLATTAKEHRRYHRQAPAPRICQYCKKRFVPERNPNSRAYEGAISNAKYCSLGCSNIARRINIKRGNKKAFLNKKLHKHKKPTKEELRELVWKFPTSKIAKLYHVSDNAVAKWCKRYGIDKPPRGYWAKKYAEQRRDQSRG